MSERSSSALVSVVIPVHDAAEYISDTLSSILSQSLQDIEVIIIDDNSADDTLKLLQSFAANDSRIRLLNNSQNIGAGASRNMGLKIASGEYIIFLDDDDYADANMLKRMYDHAALLQADVVICRCQSLDLQTHSYAPMPWSVRVDLLPQKELFSSDEITHNFFDAFIWWPWDKLFRRQAILDTGLQFQDLRTTNDLFFVSAFMLLTKRMAFLDEILISHSINRSGSLSVTIIASLDIDESDFYDDFIKAAHYRLIRLTPEEYLFSLKDRVLHELESSNLSTEKLQASIASQDQVLKAKEEEIDELRASVAQKKERIDRLVQRNAYLETEYQKQQEQLTKLQNELNNAAQRYSALISSLSWKVTRPLRLIKALITRKM
ncbi:TPA: glycosyltransferase [Klebsiella pneumoniae]